MHTTNQQSHVVVTYHSAFIRLYLLFFVASIHFFQCVRSLARQASGPVFMSLSAVQSGPSSGAFLSCNVKSSKSLWYEVDCVANMNRLNPS
jgi:hypothetical protein